MVYYRKYRPQTIDDLDNAAVRETLFSVLGNPETIPHAYLFTGPKGLGKTSTARIIAKVINCQKRQLTINNSQLPKKEKKLNVNSQLSTVGSVEPCNRCDQCVSITNGNNMDVLEIDAASNRGIDEIRDLKEKIRLAPLSSKKKVYIIDEVHMLTTEAFNALLKTLEEPPEHAMFILCTTEPQKIPSTILSRCFHIAFRLASPQELVRSFERIVKGEKITIEPEALEMIAALSEGGFRDGVKILEEVASLANDKKITKEFIEEKYKVSSIKFQVVSMFAALVKKDTKEGLRIIGKLVEQGVDMKYFLQQMMGSLHEDLLVQAGAGDSSKFTVETFPAGRQDSKLTMEEIKYLFELFSKANAEMKYAILSQLPIELAIIEWGMAAQISEDTTHITQVQVKDSVQKNEVSLTSLRKQMGTISKIKALYGSSAMLDTGQNLVKQNTVSEDNKPVEHTKVELMHVPANGQVTNEWLAALWKSIISEMKQQNHTIAGVLRGCAIKSYDSKVLVLETVYKFHKERLDDIKIRDELLRVCRMLTGKDIDVEVKLKDK